ncbi:MAG: DUF3592 domain-containing protein [Methylococcaceae bacterium]|nr:DUF3592 domain-containing protein [Methylococcaceae bacterium]MCI0733759.1 DUF3592 domain-containing protein [Methylococcaceae bacterium]
MRSAAFWMMVTAVSILAYIGYLGKFYMSKPEPWPTASGAILSNRIQAVETEDGQQFKVDIRYQYMSGDSLVEGNRIMPAEVTYSSREKAERVANAFPVGKEVKVYVNPVEKSQPAAVLVWEFPDVLSPVVFIVIVLVGSSIVLYLLSEYQRLKK